MPRRTDRLEDEETSSLSDYDSEWTQVSGTEDDSDYPLPAAASDRPLSRAETIDGSVDGDIWEGFLDEIHRSSSQSSDLARLLDVDATEETPRDQDAHVLSASIPNRDEENDTLDETPNSSLTGTLRVSRTRSATSLHVSMTESQSKLRLSFPDPLSSREDLDADSANQDSSAPTSSVEGCCENITVEDSSSFADIEAPLSPSSSETADEIKTSVSPVLPSAPYVLSLFLYGSATSLKWQIAEKVLKHILERDDNSRAIIEDDTSRVYYYDHTSLDDTMNDQAVAVRVFDRTTSSSEMDSTGIQADEPSVAILLLPSRFPAVLPRHKFYLPLISPSSLDLGSAAPFISSTFSEQVMVDSAQYTWKRLDLPSEDIIVLDKSRPHAILDASVLDSHDSAALARALSVVLHGTPKEQDSHEIHERTRFLINKWYRFAFIAATLLAITIGGVQVHRNPGSVPSVGNETSEAASAGITSHESTSTFATLVVPVNHRALTTNSLHRSLTTVIAKTTGDSTLNYIDRSPGSLKLTDVSRDVVSAVTVSPVPSKTPSKQSACRSKARSWVDKFNLSLGEYLPRDLIVRPVDILRVGSKRHVSTQDPAGTRSHDTSRGSTIKSLSLRAVQNSLEVVSTKGKALKETAEKDMVVLEEAIDELLRALRRQMNTAKDEMKDARSVAQSSFSSRNARAKENARRLRHAGEHFIKATGEHLRSRGENVMKMESQVRESARAFRQKAINSRQSRRSRRGKGRQMGNDCSERAADNSMKRGIDKAQEKKRVRNLKRRQHRMHRLQ